jgi:hypothetical protein
MKLVFIITAAIGVVAFALFFYRLPQALLTILFPNDYVYRFTLTITVGGKTFTGETVSGCRVQRSALPDWFNDAFADRWSVRVWATPLTVPLSDNRFLLLPALNVASCHATAWRPDPGWKRMLALIQDTVSGEAPIDPFLNVQTLAIENRRPILFDHAVAPKQSTVLFTRNGAEALGLHLSSVAVSPATWREVEDNLARKPGAPWLAPAVEECIRTLPQRCRLAEAGGYKALAVSLAEAMQDPAFATWTKQTDRRERITVVPDGRSPVGSALRHRFDPSDKRPKFAMTPDWSAVRWTMTHQSGFAHVVFRNEWPGSLQEPMFCSAPERCAKCRNGASCRNPYAIVDWAEGRVILALYQDNDIGRIALKGEVP